MPRLTPPAGPVPVAPAAAVVAVIALAPAVAHAGGLFVGDSGSQGMQRAGAFVAKADDPTAIYYNPAGLAKARRHEVYVGSNFVQFEQRFDRTGKYEEQGSPDQPAYVGDEYPAVEHTGGVQPIPFIGATQSFGRLAIAQGIFGPQGYPNREYPETVQTENSTEADPAPAPQRYDIVRQEVVVALPSLAAAYSVNDKLDVGARVSWGFGHLKAKSGLWGLPNPEENIKKDGFTEFDVSDSFIFGWAIGTLFRPAEPFEVGVAFTGPSTFGGRGTATPTLGEGVAMPGPGIETYIEPVEDEYVACDTGGTPAALAACTEVPIPATLTIGGRYVVRDAGGRERADLELDVRWENWANASDVEITVDGQDHLSKRRLEKVVLRHGFRDVFAFRLGGSYRIDLSGGQAIFLRGGAAYDTAAAPKSWTRVDIDGKDRFTLAGGIAWQVSRFRFDLGGGAVLEPDRMVTDVPLADPSKVDNRVQPDPAQPLFPPKQQAYSPYNAGRYESGYLVATLGITAWF